VTSGALPCHAPTARAEARARRAAQASYLFDRVLGGVLARCGCWLRVLPRARLLADANVTRALIISGTNSDAWPGYAGDLAALAARVDLATLGLVHLGDEHLTDDTAAYPRFAFVLRNYVRGGLPAVRAARSSAPGRLPASFHAQPGAHRPTNTLVHMSDVALPLWRATCLRGGRRPRPLARRLPQLC